MIGLVNGCESNDLETSGGWLQSTGHSVQQFAEENPTTNDSTHGLLGVAGLLLYGIGSTVVAANRAITASKRRDAIEEIDASSNTPKAIEQASSIPARKTIRKALK